MAERNEKGRFVKKAAGTVNKLTKVRIFGEFPGSKPLIHETYLYGSELEVFKIRMRNQYAAEFGLDPVKVDVK